MRRYSHLLILVILFHSNLFSQQNTPVEIQDVINLIDQNKVIEYITTLQNYGTRFMLGENRFQVAGWIKSQFEGMGFTNVELDSFDCHTTIDLPPRGTHIDTVTTQVNVVATLPGSEKPDEIYIICGHYDSYTNNVSPLEQAPGADDNASGTTAVLESARAIMAAGYQPKATLKFIAFAAEELMHFGDAGSEHYATQAAERGDDIKLVINNDMIGYNVSTSAIDIVNMGHQNYSNIGQAVYYAMNYSDLQINPNGYAGADLLTFFAKGYEGIYFEESIFNTAHYHKTTDIIDYVSTGYCTEVIKAACAVLLGMQQTLTGTEIVELPKEHLLYQNYPNPFNPVTIIKYQVAEPATVVMKIYNTLGEEIAEPVHFYHQTGVYQIEFDGSNLPSGLYIDGKRDNKKMLLLK